MNKKALSKESVKAWGSKTKKMISDPDQLRIMGNDIKKFCLSLLRVAIIVGVSYIILSPMIGMLVNAISSTKDAYNPMVFVLPQYPTLERFQLSIERMDYWKTMGINIIYVLSLTVIQVFICSMVGYGFARFDFPFKKLLFGCVVIMIVIPSHTIMLPLYMNFKMFDPFGLITKLFGAPINLMGKIWPMYIMSILGCGVRSGLYIYIFNQFFRGLPKEIEEAAFVDGAGTWYTYFRIMLKNAMPAVITVTVFSVVWQFNDTFYSNLFLISENVVISKKISTLQMVIANVDKILDTKIQELYLDAGVIMVVLPILIIYLVLQKYFIEGVERSGIVG